MLDQFRGSLLALACGEILAGRRSVELTEQREAARVSTPCSSQMLCILESYGEAGTFDPHDVSERIAEWYRSGSHESGTMTSAACEKLLFGYNFERASHEAWLGVPPGQRQDAECIARAAPTALFRYFDNIHLVGESRVLCSITHYDEHCRFGCAVLNIAVAHLMLIGVDGLLDELLEFAGPRNEEVTAALRAVPSLRPAELPSRNHVLDALQSSVWVALYCESVQEGLEILAQYAGEPAATCCAGGAALGARFGVDSIPQAWLEQTPLRERIDAGARRLFALAMAE